MTLSRSASYALSVLSIAIFAGCSGGSPSSGLPASTGMNNAALSALIGNRADTILVNAPPAQPDHHKSWVSPDAGKQSTLLFISDTVTFDVYIFTLPKMKLEGTLTGFNTPAGECTDAAGNVWITNSGTDQIFQYSHAGQLINTLSDPGDPDGCAVDTKTGDLAVANYNISSHDAQGDIVVYTHASGTPAQYTCPGSDGVDNAVFIGYGPRGSLWVDGHATSGAYFALCGGSSPSALSPIPISGGTIYSPGLVQWDASDKTWYVGDQYCGHAAATCIYPVSGSGVLGPAINLSTYNGSNVCDLAQGVIGPGFTYLAGGDYNYCKNANTAAYRWPFPGGGSPTNYNDTVVQAPVGAAISTK